jgi:hypothetical protein
MHLSDNLELGDKKAPNFFRTSYEMTHTGGTSVQNKNENGKTTQKSNFSLGANSQFMGTSHAAATYTAHGNNQ